MIRRHLIKLMLITAMTLAVIAIFLAGWIVPSSQNIISQAAPLVFTDSATIPKMTLKLLPAAQSPSIELEPFAGPAASSVTVKGNGWQAGNEVLISVEYQGQLYEVANTVVTGEGDFTVSFFIPSFWKNQTTVTVVAHVVGGPQASAFFTVTNVPTPTPTVQPQEAQGVVNTNALNVRTGPGVIYPVVGRLLLDQTVRITGQNSGWWQIEFPNATSDFGWVDGQYLNATNVENVPIQIAPPTPIPPTPTPIPTPTFQCNPGQWSGCGGNSCAAEYVSQCGNNGQWMQCLWDPGHCIPPQTNNYEENNHTHHHHDNHDHHHNSSDNYNPDLNWYPLPLKK